MEPEQLSSEDADPAAYFDAKQNFKYVETRVFDLYIGIGESCADLPGMESFVKEFRKNFDPAQGIVLKDLWAFSNSYFPFHSEAGIVPFMAGRRSLPYRIKGLWGHDPSAPGGIIRQLQIWDKAMPLTTFSYEAHDHKLQSVCLACVGAEITPRPYLILFYLGTLLNLVEWSKDPDLMRVKSVELGLPRPVWAPTLEADIGVPVSWGHQQTRILFS